MLNRCKLPIPPSDGLAENVACIIAFPRSVKERPVDILANLPDVTEPYRRAAVHRLGSELNSKGDLCERVHVAAILLEQVIALPLDKLAEDLVLRIRAFPLFERCAGGLLDDGIRTVHLVEDVANRPDQGNGCCPVNAPSLDVCFFFEKR